LNYRTAQMGLEYSISGGNVKEPVSGNSRFRRNAHRIIHQGGRNRTYELNMKKYSPAVTELAAACLTGKIKAGTIYARKRSPRRKKDPYLRRIRLIFNIDNIFDRPLLSFMVTNDPDPDGVIKPSFAVSRLSCKPAALGRGGRFSYFQEIPGG